MLTLTVFVYLRSTITYPIYEGKHLKNFRVFKFLKDNKERPLNNSSSKAYGTAS